MRFVFQTMMSSRIRPPSAGGAGRTLHFTMSDAAASQGRGGNSFASAIARDGPDKGVVVVEPDGIEPTTSCLQSTRSTN